MNENKVILRPMNVRPWGAIAEIVITRRSYTYPGMAPANRLFCQESTLIWTRPSFYDAGCYE